MSLDAYQIWREGAGQVKQSSVRAIWPALATALDDRNIEDEAQEETQPTCRSCRERLAIGRAGDIPVCGRCAGLAEFRALKLTRVNGWRTGRTGA